MREDRTHRVWEARHDANLPGPAKILDRHVEFAYTYSRVLFLYPLRYRVRCRASVILPGHQRAATNDAESLPAESSREYLCHMEGDQADGRSAK